MHDNTVMRLSAQQISVIKSLTEQVFGPSAEVRLFGSRAHDDSRGGDIDLMVTLPTPVERPALLAAQLAGRLQAALGEQHLDIVLEAPNLLHQSIHKVARAEGVLL